MLVSGSVLSSVHKPNSWREDTQEDISLDEWNSIFTEAQTQTVNTQLSLLQYNRLMWIYVNPAK